MHSLRPSLKGGYGEERHHGWEDIIKVEIIVQPYPLILLNLGWISINKDDELAPGIRNFMLALVKEDWNSWIYTNFTLDRHYDEKEFVSANHN